MLLHNSYINPAIANSLVYCKGLYSRQKSRNARSTHQETLKSAGFSTLKLFVIDGSSRYDVGKIRQSMILCY